MGHHDQASLEQPLLAPGWNVKLPPSPKGKSSHPQQEPVSGGAIGVVAVGCRGQLALLEGNRSCQFKPPQDWLGLEQRQWGTQPPGPIKALSWAGKNQEEGSRWQQKARRLLQETPRLRLRLHGCKRPAAWTT